MTVGPDSSDEQVDPTKLVDEGFVPRALEIWVGVDTAEQVGLSRGKVDFGKDCGWGQSSLRPGGSC